MQQEIINIIDENKDETFGVVRCRILIYLLQQQIEKLTKEVSDLKSKL